MAKRDRGDPGFTVINVRVPDALAAQLDAHATALEKKTPGTTVTRSSLIRVAIEDYLRSATPKPARSAK